MAGNVLKEVLRTTNPTQKEKHCLNLGVALIKGDVEEVTLFGVVTYMGLLSLAAWTGGRTAIWRS